MVLLKQQFFWHETGVSLVKGHRRFDSSYCRHLQVQTAGERRSDCFGLKIQALSHFEKSVNTCGSRDFKTLFMKVYFKVTFI